MKLTALLLAIFPLSIPFLGGHRTLSAGDLQRAFARQQGAAVANVSCRALAGNSGLYSCAIRNAVETTSTVVAVHGTTWRQMAAPVNG